MNKNIITVIVIVIIIVVLGIVWYGVQGNSKDQVMNDESAMDMENDAMENDGQMDEEVEGVMVGGAMMLPSMTIVENAMNAENLTTLVAAVKAAGLVETLSGEGPFTVFAPTNKAFAELPEGTVENLLKPENKDKLQAILTYHVVPGMITSNQIQDGETFTTVNGDTLTITIDENGNYVINGEAQILIKDIIDSNGVSYAIDTVLIPTPEM